MTEDLIAAVKAEPVAWLYQHEETGRTVVNLAGERLTLPEHPGRYGLAIALYAHPPVAPTPNEEVQAMCSRLKILEDVHLLAAAGDQQSTNYSAAEVCHRAAALIRRLHGKS